MEGCRMFSCLPDVFLEQDASIVRLMSVYHRGRPQQNTDGGDLDGWK